MSNKPMSRRMRYIRSYMDATKNAATLSTVDSNANVTARNVATMSAEINKPDFIELNRAIVKEYLKKKNGNKLVRLFVKDLKHHNIYSHDETSLMPYTYSSKEVVNVKYNGEKLLVSLDQLYDLVEAEEKLLDDEKVVYGKFPTGLEILDRNGWTSVSRLIRKKRHRDLVRVKTAFGEDIVVTDNHPIIIGENVEDTISAIDGLGHKQYKYQGSLSWSDNGVVGLDKVCDGHIKERFDGYFTVQSKEGGCVHLCPNAIALTEELGYFVGFFIGDGNYNKNERYTIQITQKDRYILEKLANIGIKYFNATPKIAYDSTSDKFALIFNSPALAIMMRDYFGIGEYAQRKTIPANILETNKSFAKGVIWGLVDSDGTVRDGCINIRLSSRAGINQLCWIMKDLGYTVGTSIQEATVGFEEQLKNGYTQNYTIWGIQSTVTSKELLSDYSFKAKSVVPNNKGLKYKDGWVNIVDVKVLQPGLFLNEQNDYIYDITTDTHSFICNNIWVHNCVAVSLYPFVLNGLKDLGGTSGPPKHADSFVGGLTNLIFLIAGQFAGAVAAPEFLPYLDHFLRLDYGEDYLDHLDETVETFGNRKATLKTKISDLFQQFVYCVNQPAAARGYQSPFVNIGYFDKYYFESLFNEFVFPDGDEPQWESTKQLQKFFMKWFNNERTKEVITFPVETMNLLWDTETKKYRDEDMADFTAEMWSEGHSFFLYNSDSADALSSCCFSKDQKVLARSCNHGQTKVYYDTFENIGKTVDGPDRKQFEVFHNGSWCHATKIILPNRKMYKIVTANNKEIIVSDNHLNPTIYGDIQTDKLTTNDYLLFNVRSLEAFPEQDLHLTYEQGFAVGAFLGDGSFGTRMKLSDGSTKIYDVNYSQNITKYERLIKNVNKANKQLGGDNSCCLNEVCNNVYPVRISSEDLVKFIQHWTNWSDGTNAYTKQLNLECLLQSKEFRLGILDGWYNTDGGNSNRCYTISQQLAETMEVLITSLGMNSVITVADRSDEVTYIRGEKVNHNYPIYTVRWYDMKNKRSMGDIYKVINNSVYFKIKSIEPIDYDGDIYCFEMKNLDEPYFTLPNGIITHNCRLKNAMESNEFSYTLGAGGVMTGSKKVITLNINRLAQDWYRKSHRKLFKYKGTLSDYITEITNRVHKYLEAWNDYLWDLYNADLLTVYKAGFIELDKQYLTIGFNGFIEGAEFLSLQGEKTKYNGLKIRPDNEQYKQYARDILVTIKNLNFAHRTEHLKFNTEQTPCENAGAKLYKWDKRDGYWVPKNRNLYNSYFYPVEDSSYNPIEKLFLQGTDFIGCLDGGSAYHCNLDSYLSKEQYRKIMDIAIEAGCSYFTFNIPNTICNKCGNIDKRKLCKCPKCGSKNIDFATRIIGYLKRVSNFPEVRQKEELTRYYDGKLRSKKF